MADTKRTLFPPMSNTVSFPTLSAEGNTDRISANESNRFSFMRLYHRARAFLVSGCLSANSLSRFRVIMCIRSSVGEPRAFFIFCYLAFPPGCLPGIEGSLPGHKPERTRLVVQPSELPDRRLRRCDLPANPPPQRGRRLGGPRL